MESQKTPYPPQVVNILAGIMASKDAYANNYLKGPELVTLFQSLGFPDNYTFVDGRGIQTIDFGEGLSRLTYTTKRLEAINKTLQMPDAIKKYIDSVKEPVEALNSIKEVLNRFNLPSINIADATKVPSIVKLNSEENVDVVDSGKDKFDVPIANDSNVIKEKSKNDKRKLDMEKSILGEIPKGRPVVFISYSWDSETHKDWVAKLAEDLAHAGIFVLLDQYLEDGTMLPVFMELGLERANKVLVIGTKNYKEKSSYNDTGAAFEGCVIRAQIFQNLGTKKFISCLRDGAFKDSFPLILTGNKGHDFSKDENYNDELENLCREIWKKPKRQRPELGRIPDYVKS